MKEISAEKIAEIERLVEAEWPNDRVLHEIHIIRMHRQEQMRGMSNREKAAFMKKRVRPKPNAA